MFRVHYLLLVLYLFNAILMISSINNDREFEDEGQVYHNTWAVYIEGGHDTARSVAERHGFTMVGQIGSLEDRYHFRHDTHPERSSQPAENHHSRLTRDIEVLWAEQQILKKRVKREFINPYTPQITPEFPLPTPSDSQWSSQWYINSDEHNMNIISVWQLGITGKGVVISVLDDGLQHDHPDLEQNYDEHASFDYNSHDADPEPRLDPSNTNRHGTRCAGEIAASKNTICSIGVAYESSIGGIRMLDGSVNDIVEGSSLGFRQQHIDIYSSSWGPDDDGRTVDGPGSMAKKAFEDGVNRGRSGLGNIFVWASGNGGAHDSCNCDGYAISIYTISVSSVSDSNSSPWYSEHCSSTLTSTYSSGNNYQGKITTTDIRSGCTNSHTGTSASAPLAAGIIALALQINPHLTWRDIQHIIVLSSRHDGLDGQWTLNGANHSVSSAFGYGLLDAGTLVNRASSWITVGDQHKCVNSYVTNTKSTDNVNKVELSLTVDGCFADSSLYVKYLEHVQLVLSISINNGMRGDIEIYLTSPSGFVSQLLHGRMDDRTNKGFTDWPFMSIQFWGEYSTGVWKLKITCTNMYSKFTLQNAELNLYGTAQQPPSHECIPDACHSECAVNYGCSGSNASDCDRCKNYRVKDTLECVSTCPKGFYQDDDNKLCLRCSLDCSRCDQLDPNNCLACATPYNSINGSCMIQCDSTDTSTYSKSCFACHESCQTCSGKSSKSCTSCRVGMILTSQGTCNKMIISNECGSKMYLDTYDSCKPCPLGCAKCLSHDTCLECIDNSTEMIESNICHFPCPLGYFNQGKKCVECHPTCLACSSGVSPTDCTDCADGFKLSLEYSCVPCCDLSHLLTICCNCTRGTKNTCSLVKLREESILGEFRYYISQTSSGTLLIWVIVSLSILVFGCLILIFSALFMTTFSKFKWCNSKSKSYRILATDHFETLDIQESD